MPDQLVPVHAAMPQNTGDIRTGESVGNEKQHYRHHRDADHASRRFNDKQHAERADRHVQRIEITRAQYQIVILRDDIQRTACREQR